MRALIKADPVPAAWQAGEVAFVVLPVTVLQRAPGGYRVTGSGLTRFVERGQLLHPSQVPMEARR